MKVSEALIRTKELIQDPARWCQMAYARDQRGNATSEHDPNAVQWCTAGALYRTCGDRLYPLTKKVWALLYKLAPRCVIPFNDHATHAEVMDLFDRAIAVALEQETAEAKKEWNGAALVGSL